MDNKEVEQQAPVIEEVLEPRRETISGGPSRSNRIPSGPPPVPPRGLPSITPPELASLSENEGGIPASVLRKSSSYISPSPVSYAIQEDIPLLSQQSNLNFGSSFGSFPFFSTTSSYANTTPIVYQMNPTPVDLDIDKEVDNIMQELSLSTAINTTTPPAAATAPTPAIVPAVTAAVTPDIEDNGLPPEPETFLDQVRDEFNLHRYMRGKSEVVDTYNFWTPLADIVRKPFLKTRDAIKGRSSIVRALCIFPGLGVPFLLEFVLRFTLGGLMPPNCPLLSDLLKSVGNLTNLAANSIGASVNFILKGTAKALDLIGNTFEAVFDQSAKAVNQNSFFSLVGFFGRLATLALSPFKAIGAVFHIASKAINIASTMAQEIAGVLGSIARIITTTRATDLSAVKSMYSGLTRVAWDGIMVGTAAVKEAGTQLKEMGNGLDIPIVSQVLRGGGNVMHMVAQIAEGISQGIRKLFNFAPTEAWDAFKAGMASAGKTIYLGMGESVGKPKELDAPQEKYTLPGIEATKYTVEQEHKTSPRDFQHNEENVKKDAEGNVKKESVKRSSEEIMKGAMAGTEGKSIKQHIADLKAEHARQLELSKVDKEKAAKHKGDNTHER